MSFEQNFRIIIEKIFNSWPDLRLAVEHGMGGRNGHKTAIDIMNYAYEYCIHNENITQSELQDVIEELMDQEFDTICDDNSIPEICAHLLKYLKMCKEEKFAEIEVELARLPQVSPWLTPDAKIVYTRIEDDSSSSEGDSESESDMDVDMTENAGSSSKAKEDFVEPEPGWTTVRTKRK